MGSKRKALELWLKSEERLRKAEEEIQAATEEIKLARITIRSEINGNHGVNISQRQQQVLDLVRLGMTNKEIAVKLYIEERTVKFHLSSLLSKFNVRERKDL